MKRRHKQMLIAGLGIVALTLGAIIVFGDRLSFDPGLYSFAVVSGFVAAGALIAEPLGVSPAIVELSLGVLAGALGVPRSETLDILGLMGSIFIMYVAGLEIEPAVLKRDLISSLFSGLTSFFAPLAATYVALTHFGFFAEESLLAGIGVSTTSVAVVYAIIRKHGVIRRRLGQLILAVAMVADVTSIIAFVLAASAHTLSMAMYFMGILVSPFLLAFFLEWASGGEHEVELKLILAFLVAASLVSEYFGVHAILFAFLLGVATRETVVRRPVLESKVMALTFGVLAPIFFVNAGLHASPANPLVYLEMTALVFLVSFPVKIIATHYSLKLFMDRSPGRITAVFGARLTVSTVIAFAGEAAGVLSHDLAGAVIMSALIATIVSAIIAGTPIPEEA
ncbi:MAG: cation:proton antiporter [Desulfurococcales archaeon]|nr:cation:proton antiporter [Desulfurococcales archaeon]